MSGQYGDGQGEATPLCYTKYQTDFGAELPCSPPGAFKKGTPTGGWHLGTKHPSFETPESVAKRT